MKTNKKYVIGNWKMNPMEEQEARNLLREVERGAEEVLGKVEVVVCPPTIFLAELQHSSVSVKIGAQNVFWEDSGAFTGEVSVVMLKRLGVGWAILGHSERRGYLGESDEMVNRKLHAVLRHKLRAVVCVGETEKERREELAEQVIVRQLEQGLAEVSADSLLNAVVIAYEPVWAIGSGVVPTADDIMSVNLLIKKTLHRIYGQREVVEGAVIIYGGSVVVDNVRELVGKTGMQGVLVGGASLRAGEFVSIAKIMGDLDQE